MFVEKKVLIFGLDWIGLESQSVTQILCPNMGSSKRNCQLEAFLPQCKFHIQGFIIMILQNVF